MNTWRRVPPKKYDTDYKRTCPWCGESFKTPQTMQAHERHCDEWR